MSPSLRFVIIALAVGSVMALAFTSCCTAPPRTRTTESLTQGWRFAMGDVPRGEKPDLNDGGWRELSIPHDWSIEGAFSKDHPATPGGGALPGGIGWYRRSFTVSPADSGRLVFVEFDGVYRNSDVWINGHHLGRRPYGYSSFRYELTPFLNPPGRPNLLAVRVDNAAQPNSRWYSGSGIYRNVRLVTTGRICVDHWGTFVTTPEVSDASASVNVKTRVRNATGRTANVILRTDVAGPTGEQSGYTENRIVLPADAVTEVEQHLTVVRPILWSVDSPSMYTATTTITSDGAVVDEYITPFGVRTFTFDRDRGFMLNGRAMKIRGVCMHHDLGCLGAAVNRRAIERQLEILKAMGVNGIRTSHNPPAPELLDLCDAMGFIVLDEAFDMWKTKKTGFDYALDWDAWHVRDLTDLVVRDRNHPSVFMWSIGNEVMEQWKKDDSSGVVITRELAGIVRSLDPTRPITAACNGFEPANPLIVSGALDLIGANYSHAKYPDYLQTFPAKPFLGTETTSALATRGCYDMPADSIRRWPIAWDKPFTTGNPDLTCSSYDNCSAPWGSTHEESWKMIKAHPFLSGMFIWTGFDYLGEPTPYLWPARSSYFGIVDLAGFPKDAYYMYQSEWTQTPVLHLLPHWNWKKGDTVDVWAYTNCASVELFLNGRSLGVKSKKGDDLHISWRVAFEPGTLKAVGRSTGQGELVTEVRTAGAPHALAMAGDRTAIRADGTDLTFVTVSVLDGSGIPVPVGRVPVTVEVSGDGVLAGLDNGCQTDLRGFRGTVVDAFNGKCLAVVRAGTHPGSITVTAKAAGLVDASVTITTK
jgi:beta-galactosidase